VNGRLRAVVTIVLVALVSSVVWFVYGRLEQVEEEVYVGFQGEARRNSFLAAARMLERMGFVVRSIESLDRMPPAGRTLVLAEETRALTQGQVTDLVTWVAAGGRLVVSPARDKFDQLLYSFSLAPVTLSDGGKKKAFTRLVQTDFRFDDPKETLRARLRDDLWVRYAGSHDAKTPPSAPGPIVTIPMLKGTVTAVSDLEFIENARIGDLDHAKILWRLVSGAESGEVWLVHGEEAISLATLLWRTAWMPLVTLALAFVAWTWGKARRFGPVLFVAGPGSRSLLEHVESAGAFLWRRGSKEVLFDATREAMERGLAARRPYLARLTAAEKSTRLAGELGLPRRDILAALAGPCPDDPAGFTRAIHILESLRRAM